jgi:hypothetical protein
LRSDIVISRSAGSVDRSVPSTGGAASPRTALVLIDVIAAFFTPGASTYYPASAQVLPSLRTC